jgi:hypothetical protein
MCCEANFPIDLKKHLKVNLQLYCISKAIDYKLTALKIPLPNSKTTKICYLFKKQLIRKNYYFLNGKSLN